MIWANIGLQTETCLTGLRLMCLTYTTDGSCMSNLIFDAVAENNLHEYSLSLIARLARQLVIGARDKKRSARRADRRHVMVFEGQQYAAVLHALYALCA